MFSGKIDRAQIFRTTLLALLGGVLLVLAFPDWEKWYLAFLAFIPLIAMARDQSRSVMMSFIGGWLFGLIYFVGTVWWLTYSPIRYGGFPPWLAYTLLVCVCSYVALFPAIFTALISYQFKKIGNYSYFAVPFIWVATEFGRYWLSSNSWNAVGYSQAFGSPAVMWSSFGGVYLVSFMVVAVGSAAAFAMIESETRIKGIAITAALVLGIFSIGFFFPKTVNDAPVAANVIVIQVNVPMSGLTYERWNALRARHIEMSEAALTELKAANPDSTAPVLIVFPESPMNFMYREDAEFREFIGRFAQKNNVGVLFNSAEPDAATGLYFNSAVMVDAKGSMVDQYDKIYLVPFGEFVPGPLRSLIPGLIGSFASGGEYDVFPVGDAKAAVMLCYESNFGQLGRYLAINGADIFIEMTNDGYLGETPVLRQHLSSAVFRAIETDRPVLRATNVGITAYVDELGNVSDAGPIYAETTKFWQIRKSNGEQTLYVKFGDWIAWLSLLVTLAAIGYARFKKD